MATIYTNTIKAQKEKIEMMNNKNFAFLDGVVSPELVRMIKIRAAFMAVDAYLDGIGAVLDDQLRKLNEKKAK